MPGGRKGRRGPRSVGHQFFDAVLRLARSGACWRDLSEGRFGSYQITKQRYYRWIEQGIFASFSKLSPPIKTWSGHPSPLLMWT